MSSPKGIFDTSQNPSAPAGNAQSSPFGVAADSAPQSPFPAASFPQACKESPFSVFDVNEAPEDSKTILLTEPRMQAETPFQISEPHGFGFEAASQTAMANPFEAAPQPQHWARPREQALRPQYPVPLSPFSVEHQPAAPSPCPAPASPYGGWAQDEASHIQAAYDAPQSHAQYQPPAGHYPCPTAEPSGSDSFQIKQLELRAIFGVDREMSKEEIIQRSRSLPGVRQIAMASASDIAAVDALKQVISNLGFGSGALKLYSGSVPIEFIREDHTLLAVQTDGGFAPGVREALILVARELSR